MNVNISNSLNKKRITLAGIALLILILLSGSVLSGCLGQKGKDKDSDSLVVFNYGDYIDRETIDIFEEETGIKVKYEEYLTPEDMYTKYSSGVIDYDLICTSDYMIQKMMMEGHLKPVDFSKMDYYGNIDPVYLDFCKSFDPENQYAVPYLWGTLGILYNEDMVEEEPDSWAILWDEKYKNQILMQNSMRDAFLVPLKWKGLSVNTDRKEDLLAAQQLLIDQKPLVEAYLVDEIRDAMIAGEAAMAVTYSGDAT
jgi:spermidine/putrescine-binding protein